jgi:hypothetical protein
VFCRVRPITSEDMAREFEILEKINQDHHTNRPTVGPAGSKLRTQKLLSGNSRFQSVLPSKKLGPSKKAFGLKVIEEEKENQDGANALERKTMEKL